MLRVKELLNYKLSHMIFATVLQVTANSAVVAEPIVLTEAGTNNAVKSQENPKTQENQSTPANNVTNDEIKSAPSVQNTQKQTATSSSSDTIKTEGVEVKAKKFRVITPLPGLSIDRGTSTTNIQSATGKEIAESKAINVTEFMNSELQSVSVNDYAGNPFQQDLNFRGFTASPSIGTPQGISVYLDGVRVNEAFGDVVNWNLIPMNAIQSLDLISGTNPLFGLNTLGGALAIRTKNGFTDHYLRAQMFGGAWGRQQVQVSNGYNNGTIGFFSAYNHFEEDGWRKSSPSGLRQLFNVATMRLGRAEINLSALNIDSELVGNGLLPIETAAIPSLRDSVYTAPDSAKSNLRHYNLNIRWDVTDNASISLLAYRRYLDQNAVGAEVYGNPAGRYGTDPAMNGVFDVSSLSQENMGGAIQLSMDLDKHQISAGITYDANRVKFQQTQQLGLIDENHVLRYVTPDYDTTFFDVPNSALDPVVRNNLRGGSHTSSLFATDTWSPTDNLHITYGARFNWTNVTNFLRADRGADLNNLQGVNLKSTSLECKSTTNPGARWICSEGDYNYFSFNPALGVAWEAKEDLTVYSNISRGSRAPTVIELGCALDPEKDKTPGSTNYQSGCSIPTALTSDPYLKQVRSTAYEAGLRGSNYGFDWNVGAFRTELKDDILFVPLGTKNRGVFDNFGQTLRQGIEMGMKGTFGKSTLSLNYTWMRATFESPAIVINESHSANTAPTTLQAFVTIEKGDQLPGMPNHIFQANWKYQFSDRFDTSLGMIAHSSAFVRGNESNDYAARPATNDASTGVDRDPYDYVGIGKTSGYAVLNLRANYKFDHGITAFLKVDNLLDKDYATAGVLGRNQFTANGVYQEDGAAWTNTTFIGLGAPRALWVGLNFDLGWNKFNKKEKSK